MSDLSSRLNVLNWYARLSDPYVKISLLGDASSRQTSIRKKTLNPKWQQPLLLKVHADKAQGELTKKGSKKACYGFKPGAKLDIQVFAVDQKLASISS